MFNWFGRKSGRPALPRHALPSAGGWIAGWTAEGDVPAGYDARVRAALGVNPVASRAIRLVTESAGAAPLKVRGGEGADARGAVAALLAHPNPRETRAAFLETIAAHLLLHGNAFLDAATGSDGRPAELHALRPDRVTVETGTDGWPAAYLYRAGETRVRLAAHCGGSGGGGGDTGRSVAGGVLHIRMLNPVDDHYGLGCLAAAAWTCRVH